MGNLVLFLLLYILNCVFIIILKYLCMKVCEPVNVLFYKKCYPQHLAQFLSCVRLFIECIRVVT